MSAHQWDPRDPAWCSERLGLGAEPQGSCGGWRHLVLEAKWQFCFVGEEIEITFSYWDGSGHRRTVKVGSVGPAPCSQCPWDSVRRSFNPNFGSRPLHVGGPWGS